MSKIKFWMKSFKGRITEVALWRNKLETDIKPYCGHKHHIEVRFQNESPFVVYIDNQQVFKRNKL